MTITNKAIRTALQNEDIELLSNMTTEMGEKAYYIVCNSRNFRNTAENNSTYISLQRRWEMIIDGVKDITTPAKFNGNSYWSNWGDVIA